MRTVRWLTVLVAPVLVGSTLAARALSAPRGQSPSSLVELDVVAVDDSGRPVDDLRQEDFRVREDGAAMALASFTPPHGVEADESGRVDGRSVVLLLDDSSVSPRLTSRVQDIAKQFVSRVGVADRLSVVRLSSRRDEPINDRAQVLMRIDEYRGGAIPFAGRETIENALTRIAKLSGGFDQLDLKRRAIVAIGSAGVFDLDEPPDRQASLIWRYWVGALTAAARAHASVYVIDPHGLSGALRMQRDGIVARTGGTAFYNRNDFSAAVQQVWQDGGHYYLLGYPPSSKTRDLHEIDVRTTRAGVHVRARRTR